MAAPTSIKAANNTAATVSQPKSATSSPRDTKKTLPPKFEPQVKDSPSQTEARITSPRQPEQAPPVSQVEASNNDDSKPASNATQPLAPPPKPGQQPSAAETPDYFAGAHGNTHFSLEPNPFEQSFGNPSSAETPGRFPGLPSVASLTSPAPLGPGGTPGWHLGGSLRSGPLSPAMLAGPANPSGYFDEQFRQSFPTPNESSLRTGLTPGGGGSMFPAPSPNSQAIFNSMQGGLATPGTVEFQRTAMNAAARSKNDGNHQQPMGPTPVGINKQDYQPAQQAQMGGVQDPFNHPDRDAVNSLYMLAQTGNRNANQFAVPPQPQGMPANTAQMQSNRGQPTDASPTAGRGQKHSIGSLEGSAMSENGDYDMSDGSMNNKPASKSKPKKGSASKATPGSANINRRKAEDSVGKAPPNKRAKSNSGAGLSLNDMDMGDDDSGDDVKLEDELHPSGRKMTDEEKRKNFLERNRIAALKCRQRKKQWLANLQAKVEIFSTENDQLSNQNQRLQEEIVNLKSLLLAHKDCTVSHQQGLGGPLMAQMLGGNGMDGGNNNPYGMGMPQSGHMMQMPQQGMQRR